MQIAYFDCFSGISGDMTLGALIDAGAELQLVQMAIDSMDLGAVRISIANTAKRGFHGKLLSIEHPPEHSHRFLRDIHALLRRAKITTVAKDLAMRVFERIARAEAKVHGTTIDRVQFHEVGAIDSIVDIVGVAVAWDSLGIQKAYASPIPTGVGQVRIAHGIVSIPAPATAELLVGVPIAPSQIPIEMTTPTGAAIITELASEFGPMPPMQVGRIGYGAGRKEMPDRPNLLRILIGQALKTKPQSDDFILVMETNLDDITGEQIGFAIEQLWAAGALDVYTVSIQMKKNRPGTLLTVIAKPNNRQAMESILFEHTGTLGIRYRKQPRTLLCRSVVDVLTPWGTVPGKVSKLPSGIVEFSPEYDDCSRIARDSGLRLNEVTRTVEECFRSNSNSESALGVGAADAMFLNGASDFLGAETALDRVNSVFRQAALEDELDSAASRQAPFESGFKSKPEGSSQFVLDELDANANSRATNDSPPEIADTLYESHNANANANVNAEGNQQSYYRWDSSPWSHDEPTDSTIVASEFPLSDAEDS